MIERITGGRQNTFYHKQKICISSQVFRLICRILAYINYVLHKNHQMIRTISWKLRFCSHTKVFLDIVAILQNILSCESLIVQLSKKKTLLISWEAIRCSIWLLFVDLMAFSTFVYSLQGVKVWTVYKTKYCEWRCERYIKLSIVSEGVNGI